MVMFKLLESNIQKERKADIEELREYIFEMENNREQATKTLIRINSTEIKSLKRDLITNSFWDSLFQDRTIQHVRLFHSQ